MKGIMKKIISALLVLIMLVSLVPTMVFANGNSSYYTFQANRYAELFERNCMNDGTSYGRTYYNMLENDKRYKADIIAWETLSSLASPSNLGEVITKQDYYKTVLFDLVVNKNEDTYGEKVEDIGQYLLGEVKNSTNKFMVSTAKEILKTEDGASANELKLMPLTESRKLIIAGDVASTASDVMQLLEWCDNVADAIQVTANYLALRQVEKGTKEVLTYIANDSQNCFDLRYAASTMIECIGEGSQSVVNSMKQGAWNLFADTFGAFVNAVWNNVTKTIPGIAALHLTLKGARVIVDYLMSSEAKSRAYYQLEANVRCEDALKSAVGGLKQRYLNDSSENNAIGYMRAVTMYEDVVLLGFEYSIDLLTVVVNSNWNKLFGTYNKGFEVINDINRLKSQKSSRYKEFEDMVFNTYINTYIPDYNNVYEDLENQWSDIEVRYVEFVLGSYTAFLNHRLIIPANTYPSYANVGTDIIYSSSDTRVIRVGSDASVTPVGPGTADIIATSSNGVQGRCKITVIPYTAAENETGYTIVSYQGEYNTLNIPKTVNGVYITTIAPEAFEDCDTLNSVIIPESVASIGEFAFYDCDGLSSISLPDGLSSIGRGAFRECDNLLSISIPANVTAIRRLTFAECERLISVDIPNGVTDIESWAFASCKSITSINIPSSVVNIGDGVFYECDNLVSINIPEGVTCIDVSTFEGCKNLRSLVLPSSVNVIREHAFRDCTSLVSIAIPDGVAEINVSTFQNCTSLASVSIPSSVKTINAYAFRDCTSLKSLKIPFGVTDIGVESFEGCSSLSSLTISDSVTNIGYQAFRGCNSLVMVNIPSSVAVIDGAFYECRGLTNVIIEEGVSNIGYNTFYKCINLSSVSIPSSVKSIGSVAFGYCSSLTSISIPDGITRIENGTFSDCTNLHYVNIPDSVTFIDDGAFIRCSKLKSISIPHNVIDMGGATFSGCSSLMEMNIPTSVSSIEVNCFNDCPNLVTVKIPVSVTNIERYAFRDCSNLSDVYYDGTREQWMNIFIDSGNDSLAMATVHCVPSDNLAFSGASLTLHDNISINFKANESLFTEVGYENPYVVYELNGEEFIVSDYEIVGGKYVFDFADIAPNNMNDTVKATLYATFDGVEYVSETREYSVATYCYNMLNKYTTAEYAELQTLLVDLLNYGAMSQIYTSYRTDDLVNANLTDAQKAWGTSETPAYETVQNIAYKTIENPTVTWKGGGLNLVDAVTMRFKITADSYENLVVTAETDDRIWTIPYEEFSETTGGYYVYFSGLNAGEMSEPVYLTVYENDEAVSNTLSYSIESYAYSKQTSTDTNLTNLLEAMMKYGNSVYAYAN